MTNMSTEIVTDHHLKMQFIQQTINEISVLMSQRLEMLQNVQELLNYGRKSAVCNPVRQSKEDGVNCPNGNLQTRSLKLHQLPQ